ncbi:MAG: hypothetical protein KQ78_00582 [Candidatus Izimaplasma bacterium HR2]|nr:MAG: hypothetical protein KQ78_00582 [Candidatus Izimaplasma bacterium HR2]
MKYDIKIDLWIKLLFLMSIGILIGPALVMPSEEILFYVATIFPIIGVVMWLLLGSYYELQDEELLMKLGPFSGKVPYKNIKSVSLSSNWSSSWAMSMKRVLIQVHTKTMFKGDVQVGPVDREEFMDALIRRCRNLD